MKKHIAVRLAVSFGLVLALSIGVTIYANFVGEAAVVKVFANDVNVHATNTLAAIDSQLGERLDQLRIFAMRPNVVAAAVRGESSGELSRAFRREFVDYYSRVYGDGAFQEVSLYSRDGAWIVGTAAVGPGVSETPEWWRTSIAGSVHVSSDVAYDPSRDLKGIVVSVPIVEELDRVVGVLRAIIGWDAILNRLSLRANGAASSRAKIVLNGTDLLYSSGAFRFLEDASGLEIVEIASRTDGASGTATVREGGRRIVYSYVKSLGSGNLETLPLTLFIGQDEAELRALFGQLRISIGVAAVLLLIAGGGIAFLTSRTVAVPITEISAATLRMARGDLSATIDVHRHDEVGVLAESFASLRDSLREVAATAEAISTGDLTLTIDPQGDDDRLGNALKVMQETLISQIGEIADSATALRASGRQLTGFTTNLSAAAAESASAVSQTTATVEEVKQTAILSNERAAEVKELAGGTVSVAREGEESVTGSRETMARIRAQMEQVSASILSLSQQSQAIGEIVVSVAELSDQSSILAVNAAIEAARAGEHGRGFSVVAREIRELSEQSKQSTERIRALLTDIQRATNDAVLSMEQGQRSMDEGIEQTQQSGNVIKDLARRIDEASEAAMQIAASSRQQLAGMDQVAAAMESIREATNKHVSGTRDLEHQIRGLNEIGDQLGGTVDWYRVEPDGD